MLARGCSYQGTALRLIRLAGDTDWQCFYRKDANEQIRKYMLFRDVSRLLNPSSFQGLILCFWVSQLSPGSLRLSVSSNRGAARRSLQAQRAGLPTTAAGRKAKSPNNENPEIPRMNWHEGLLGSQKDGAEGHENVALGALLRR